MKTFTQTKQPLKVALKYVIIYGLPFIYFYAVADVIEILKHPLLAYQDKNPIGQWLTQNNQDNLMQYLILLIILSVWAISFQLFQMSFVKASQEDTLTNKNS